MLCLIRLVANRPRHQDQQYEDKGRKKAMFLYGTLSAQQNCPLPPMARTVEGVERRGNWAEHQRGRLNASLHQRKVGAVRDSGKRDSSCNLDESAAN